MVDQLANLDRRITDALSALRCARAIVARSGNSTTRWHEDMAERLLNDLLDQRPRTAMIASAEVLAGAAVGRPTRR